MKIKPHASADSVVSLEDLRAITADEHALARTVAARVQALVDWRTAALHAGRLDPRLDLPAGNWELGSNVNDFLAAYQHVAQGNYDTINLLRYYTNCFTGYKLIRFSGQPGLRTLEPLPVDVRAAVVSNLCNEQWVLDYYLWLKERLPADVLIDPPWLLGEVGRNVDGVIVNQDTMRHQASVATLWRTGILDHLRRRLADSGTAFVVEIGAGYGGMCHALKNILPQLTYVIVDLPEALLFSGIYASLTMPQFDNVIVAPDNVAVAEQQVTLVANYLFRDLLACLPRIDLVLNFASFGEMTEDQVENYASQLSRKMQGGGLVFESNNLGYAHIKTIASKVLARHFAETVAIDWTGIRQCDGYSHVHANQALQGVLRRPTAAGKDHSPGRRFRAMLKRLVAACS